MHQLYILSSIFRFLQGSVFFYLAIILKEMNFNGLQAGIILSMYSITPLILSIPAGFLNDRINSKVLITAAFIGNAFFYLALLKTRAFFPLLIVFFIGGSCANLLVVSIQALALKIVGNSDRGAKLGSLYGIQFISYSFGLLIGGYLMWAKMLFFQLEYSAVIFFIFSIYALFLQETAVVNISLLEYIKDFKKRSVIIFCLVFSIFAFHWGSEASSLSLFLTQHFNFTKFHVGLFMSLPIAFLGITSIIAGPLIDKEVVNIRKIIYVAFLSSGFGQILMVSNNVYFSEVMRIIHEIGDGLAGLVFMLGLARMFTKEKMGGLSSLVTFANILSMSISTMILSRVGESFGYQYSVVIGGISAVFACFLLFVFRKDI